LLAEMCRPGLDAQLLTRRPVRLLAVDDDPICRHAISFALKRTLHAPDLANDGDAGLRFAQETGYDVIFLDVEMPGMDGFELCTEIHKTKPNRATPVVFVTNQSDFDARVQSALSGGCDLIAKPFLTFELAVKALTLALQNRLCENKAAEPSESVAPTATSIVARTPEHAGAEAVAVRTSSDEWSPTPVLPPADSVEIATEFLKRAPEHLGWVNEMLHNALKLTDENAWSQTLAEVYLRLHAFTPDAKFAKGHPAMQLSSALERLLRKLLQNTIPPTKGTLMTVTAGIELLQELCADVASAARSNQPVHILVVDDDPVARRALTGVLQTSFEKPVCAENGPAALALAAEKVFDVVFLDVQMPGMDGIEVFARLRSEGRNTATPVVFVSGRTDIGAVVDVNARGDCDVVVKPFLPGELLVKALTLVLRHRREQQAAIA
jgi:CheY-like chemotaxis protein